LKELENRQFSDGRIIPFPIPSNLCIFYHKMKSISMRMLKEKVAELILRKLDSTTGQDVDALLGSLSLGIKNKWLIGDLPDDLSKVSFALKYSVIEPGKLYPMLPSEHIEALFVLDGKGLISNETQELEVRVGDLVVTGCGEMHSIMNSGKTDLRTLSCIDLVSHS
jgi:mannose-6-phosphate isomerase-like protein (cupin superfamily)